MKLRSRILILVVSLLLVVLTSLAVPLYWYTRSALEDELDQHLVTILRMVSANIDRELISLLAAEPDLNRVRQAVELNLANQVVEGIRGVALYRAGRQLAYTGALPIEKAQILTTGNAAGQPVISDLYRIDDSGYIKSGTIDIILADQQITIAVWVGADFMTFVDQLIGSLFWIFILTIIAAISLAFIFSRSLIRPVIRLADYTEAISKNIYTEPVYLNRRDELGTLNTALVDMHHEIRNNEQQNKELLSSIAHEIKNPLGGIEIYTGLLEEELPDNADHKEYLSKIISELQNLKRIILEYLDYARPPKSNLQYQKIDTIISDAVSILKPELEMKNIHCNIVGEGQVVTDESKMRRVLVNLLKNSIEAVERDGQIDISIDEDSENVKIAIRDDGEGIAEAAKAKIFQPHYSTRDRGYGLGLAIVSTIIDELNGTIVVKSEINQGAEFLITLPKQK